MTLKPDPRPQLCLDLMRKRFGVIDAAKEDPILLQRVVHQIYEDVSALDHIGVAYARRDAAPVAAATDEYDPFAWMRS